jgi:hypothetical protein
MDWRALVKSDTYLQEGNATLDSIAFHKPLVTFRTSLEAPVPNEITDKPLTTKSSFLWGSFKEYSRRGGMG